MPFLFFVDNEGKSKKIWYKETGKNALSRYSDQNVLNNAEHIYLNRPDLFWKYLMDVRGYQSAIFKMDELRGYVNVDHSASLTGDYYDQPPPSFITVILFFMWQISCCVASRILSVTKESELSLNYVMVDKYTFETSKIKSWRDYIKSFF